MGGDDETKRMRRVMGAYAADERKARAWADENPANVAMRAEIVRAIMAEAAEPLARPLPVLDVGCGTGGYLQALAREGVPAERLHGIDLVEDRLAQARERVPGANLMHGDARTLPYDDRTFGLVLLFTVLSSMPDREAAARAVQDARRVLAPGGVLAIYDMRAPSPNPQVRRITRSELRRLLGADVRLRSVTPLPPLTRRLGRLTPALYPVLARVPPLRTHWWATHRAGPGAPSTAV